MVILLTNDDGIEYVGLKVLMRELNDIGEVVVVAPERERSGVGKALSFRVTVKRVNMEGCRVAYAVSGTPADAVLIGVNKLLEDKPSVVVSGINGGPNLGLEDFFNSGTIGAAIEAALHGIPAVSVSLALNDVSYKDRLDAEDYTLAAKIARELVGYIVRHGMPSGVDLINVNVPEGDRVKGFKVTRLAVHSYGDIHSRVNSGSYHVIPWNMNMYSSGEDDDCDISAVKEGYVSVTPISLAKICSVEVEVVERVRHVISLALGGFSL